MKFKLALHYQIIIGLILGVFWAVLSSYFNLAVFTMDWIYPFGEIFIRLLKLIAVPLVLFSIIGGVAGIGDPDKLGVMGFKTLGLYISTTIIAIFLGLFLVNTISPGKMVQKESRKQNRVLYELWAKNNGEELADDKCILCDENEKEFVDNVISESGRKVVSDEVAAKMKVANKQEESGPLQFLVDMVPGNIFVSLTNNSLMLQVIFFAIFFGITLLFIPKHSSYEVVKLVNGLNDVFIKMVEIVMMAAPYFVFALMAGVVTKMAGNDISKVFEIFKGLTWYSLVVALGLVLMAFVVYPLILRLIIGKSFSYTEFFTGISKAQALAFSTSSSAATLPVTMECVEDNLKVDKRITSFVLPIGATVNMDGTSMYQAIAVIFLAHMHDVDLGLVDQIIIVLTALLASIGSAAIPGAGLVMLMIVLQTVGLDPAWIAVILPVDRLLDMLRTVVNVTGDATVSTIIAKTERLE